MNSLTTEQIARVFAMYIGQQVNVKGGNFGLIEFERAETLVGVINDYKHQYYTVANEGLRNGFYFESETYPLILRPLSSITDEDSIEVAKLVYFQNHYSFVGIVARSEDLLLVRDKYGEEDCDCFKMRIDEQYAGFMSLQIDGGTKDVPIEDGYAVIPYLIQRGYAVPLFIASGHPDNGKTAIEMGLAIDSTTL